MLAVFFTWQLGGISSCEEHKTDEADKTTTNWTTSLACARARIFLFSSHVTIPPLFLLDLSVLSALRLAWAGVEERVLCAIIYLTNGGGGGITVKPIHVKGELNISCASPAEWSECRLIPIRLSRWSRRVRSHSSWPCWVWKTGTRYNLFIFFLVCFGNMLAISKFKSCWLNRRCFCLVLLKARAKEKSSANSFYTFHLKF